MRKSRQSLDIDVRGFAQTLTDKGIARIALEPIANALDTDATIIHVVFEPHGQRVHLSVEDNDPRGFQRISDAYTLFAPSTRKGDAERRGRFGLGEKELIAVCANGGSVRIATTTGTVDFDSNGRRESRTQRAEGTLLWASIKMTATERCEFLRLLRGLIVPKRVTVTVNGRELPSRSSVRVIDNVKLQTVLAAKDGFLRRLERPTSIEVFEPHKGETPTIYELGIPVVEYDGRFHINVLQKVPLNRDRDNVTPSYRRTLCAAVIAAMSDLLTGTDAAQSWIRDALPGLPAELAAALIQLRFGEKTAVYDPSDREASKTLQDEGFEIIHGRTLTRDEHDIVRRTGIFKPAGIIRPSGVRTSPNGRRPISADRWTPAMFRLSTYVRSLGHELLDRQIGTLFFDIPDTSWAGCAAVNGDAVAINVGMLGTRWVEEPRQLAVDELLLHEFAHLMGAGDHYSREFYGSLEKLGARLRSVPTRLEGAH